jgi:hypothetical protein
MKSYFRILAALAALPLIATAATQTTVPMQGGMVMPMIAYNTTSGALSVMMPATIPQLTPLMVSHPDDSFDPANPWFDDLDPSARGYSFSRRYGFVMDVNSDPLPANTAIWLRKLAGPDDLYCYRYAASPAPGIWEPIFGTAGSSNALAWNLMMFHPAFAALPGTNGFTATFDAYLVDTTTGQEIPDTATPPMLFQFTNLLDGRPALDSGLMVMLGWDASATNYVLETAASPAATTWTTVTNQPVTLDGRPAVIFPPGQSPGAVFRMRKLP